jgi:hypothetical protein
MRRRTIVNRSEPMPTAAVASFTLRSNAREDVLTMTAPSYVTHKKWERTMSGDRTGGHSTTKGDGIDATTRMTLVPSPKSE